MGGQRIPRHRVFILGILAAAGVAAEVDPSLPDYQSPVQPLQGELVSMGSDALNNVMTFLAESFLEQHPKFDLRLEGRGGNPVPAFIAGFAKLCPLSRPMKEEELETFAQRWGYPPTSIIVAIDAVAVFVHQDNPVASLTLAQVDAAFSSTRRRGGAAVATWGDLGLGGDWSALPVTVYGRNSASATYGFFKETVLKRGDFATTVRELPGSTPVIERIAADPSGLGYTDSGYAKPGVRPVPLVDDAGIAIAPTSADIIAGRYPLQRPLRIYANRPPGGDPLIDAFLRFVLSKQGQEIAAKDGYTALNAVMAAEQRRLLD